MRMADPRKLARAARGLGDVPLDPSCWPRILEQISEAAGGTGAVLLQSDTRTSDVPHTPSVDALMRTYFADGWHLRDINDSGASAKSSRSRKRGPRFDYL
jgi:hypothetical protein